MRFSDQRADKNRIGVSMSMMKKKLIVAAALVLVIVAIACLFSIRPRYASVLKANWDITLPFKALCQEVYKRDSGASFHGDGIRYHVFSYRYEDYIDLMFAWGSQEKKTIFHSSYSQAIAAWLDEIEVPEEQRPNGHRGSCAYWYASQHDNSEIIIVWNDDLNRLYVVESFL